MGRILTVSHLRMSKYSPEDIRSVSALEQRIQQQAMEIEALRREVAGERISSRISALEKAIFEQSSMIAAMRQRTVDSDVHLQRLTAAVERLCGESSVSELPAAPLVKPVARRPLEIPAQPGFRPRIVPEKEEEKVRRHRIPMTHL